MSNATRTASVVVARYEVSIGQTEAAAATVVVQQDTMARFLLLVGGKGGGSGWGRGGARRRRMGFGFGEDGGGFCSELGPESWRCVEMLFLFVCENSMKADKSLFGVIGRTVRP